jgi:hypothetical protein
MEAGDRVHLRRRAAVGAPAALPRPAVTGVRVAVAGVPAARLLRPRLLRPRLLRPRLLRPRLRVVGVGIMPTTPRGVAALRLRAAVGDAALPLPAPVAR